MNSGTPPEKIYALEALKKGQVDAILADGRVLLVTPAESHKQRRILRVFVVDDHSIVVMGLRKLLELEEGFEIAGSTTDSREALRLIGTLLPDIVILDILMPHIDGIELAGLIKKAHPDIRIIGYTMSDEEEYVFPLFAAGAEGYVQKNEPFENLIKAMRIVGNGGMYYNTRFSAVLREHLLELQQERDGRSTLDVLSAREREIFPLLADGLSADEIGVRLFISPKTVESHKYNIYEKLQAQSLADLTKIAYREGVLDIR